MTTSGSVSNDVLNMSSAYLSSWDAHVLGSIHGSPPQREGGPMQRPSPGQTAQGECLPAIPPVASSRVGCQRNETSMEGLHCLGRTESAPCLRMGLSASPFPTSEAGAGGGGRGGRHAGMGSKAARAASVGVTSYSLLVRRPQQQDQEPGDQRPSGKKANKFFLPII